MLVTKVLKNLKEINVSITVSLPELNEILVTPTKKHRSVLQTINKVTLQQFPEFLSN